MINYFKKHFPKSCTDIPALAGIIAVFAVLYVIDYCSLPVKVPCANIKSVLGIVIIIFAALIPVSMALEKIQESIPFLSGIIEWLIKLLRLVTKPVKTIFRKIINLIITDSVIEIIEKKRRSSTQIYTFSKQPTDDDILSTPYSIDGKLIEVVINFSKKYDYWRCGMVFSISEDFPDGRQSEGHPLFHITKDIDREKLMVHYYDQGQIRKIAEEIQAKGKDCQITMTISTFNDMCIINIFNKTNILVYTHKLSGFKYVQFRAWGDRREYSLPVSITESSLFH